MKANVGRYREFVINFQHFISWVEVLLNQSDLCQTIEDINVVGGFGQR